jgi:hypothetical protein
MSSALTQLELLQLGVHKKGDLNGDGTQYFAISPVYQPNRANVKYHCISFNNYFDKYKRNRPCQSR